MSHASLAARYRPQSFAEVTGQDTIKAILSRAAAENRVAPAYLLSGTRGVGKTTIARIFAKALNCIHAPVADPCNQCEACKRITQGNHVDVIEIDGASNRGIDDARRLRESIAYAPMEGRYKVFIIDEAHMLTTESFNALLKTLEEPPPGTTFILATTEAHKFPVTIVSRCQHFVFKALSENDLTAHLTRVLLKEGMAFDETAVRLIARRAAGSVRDGMSLMGQTLALGGDTLTESTVRGVLGLAGQEMYERLLTAFQRQDCLEVVGITREMLDRGVDLGFFLRELAVLWRNLFLIRQVGPQGADALDMPQGEKDRLLALAPGFSLTYIHAAWHMVLENQRQVLTSLEPATALELLLLNLALLPRLVSMDTLSRLTSRQGEGTDNTGPLSGGSPSSPSSPSSPAAPSQGQARPLPSQALPSAVSQPMSAAPPMPQRKTAPDVAATPPASSAPVRTAPASPASSSPPASQRESVGSSEPAAEDDPLPSPAERTWENFLAHCESRPDERTPGLFQHLRQTRGTLDGNAIVLQTNSLFQYDQLSLSTAQAQLHHWAASFSQPALAVRVEKPVRTTRTEAELKQTMAEHPAIKTLETHFDASIMRCLVVEQTQTP